MIELTPTPWLMLATVNTCTTPLFTGVILETRYFFFAVITLFVLSSVTAITSVIA